MMTSSNGNIFRVTGHLCGEFTGPRRIPTQRPVTRSFDIFFDLRPNKRLRKQLWGWWFETPLCPLWRHCNDFINYTWIQHPWMVDISFSYRRPSSSRVTRTFNHCWMQDDTVILSSFVSFKQIRIHFCWLNDFTQMARKISEFDISFVTALATKEVVKGQLP